VIGSHFNNGILITHSPIQSCLTHSYATVGFSDSATL
jgi:hypothetical protein